MTPAGPDSEAVVIHPVFKKLRDKAYVRGRRKGPGGRTGVRVPRLRQVRG